MIGKSYFGKGNGYLFAWSVFAFRHKNNWAAFWQFQRTAGQISSFYCIFLCETLGNRQMPGGKLFSINSGKIRAIKYLLFCGFRHYKRISFPRPSCFPGIFLREIGFGLFFSFLAFRFPPFKISGGISFILQISGSFFFSFIRKGKSSNSSLLIFPDKENPHTYFFCLRFFPYKNI